MLCHPGIETQYPTTSEPKMIAATPRLDRGGSGQRFKFAEERFVVGQGFALFVKSVVVSLMSLFELAERFA